MRACLVKYTDVSDFHVEKRPASYEFFREKSAKATRIKWKLTKLTEEEEAAMRSEINAQFATQDSPRNQEQVLEWKIGKRFKWKPWNFEIICDRHHNAHDPDKTTWLYSSDEEDDEPEEKDCNCSVSFHFHDNFYEQTRPRKSCGSSRGIYIDELASIEFLVQFGNSFIFFNDVTQQKHSRCSYPYDRYVQYDKSVPVEVCNQLENVSKDQIAVTVFGVFDDPNVKPGLRLGSNRARLTSPESNWKLFLDQQRTDVTIVADGGELVDCHWSYITRNSRVLSQKLSPPTRKSFVVELLDLSRIQVEAFLRYQYSGTTDKILEAPATSVGVLKAAERYEIWEMWNDTMKGLLEKESHWFGADAAHELTSFLGKCSKKEEEATQSIIDKLSLVSRRQGHPGGSNLGRVGGLDETRDNDKSDKNTNSEGMNQVEAESGCHNLDRIKEGRNEELGKMLESPCSSLSLLKLAQSYKNEGMWNDIISALLEKDSDWFDGDHALELKTFLNTCVKKNDLKTQELVRKLSLVLEQSNQGPKDASVDAGGEAVTQEEQNCDALVNQAKRRKVIISNQTGSTVGTTPAPNRVNLNVRKTGKREARKEKPVQKRGVPTQDESWKKALEVAAKNAKKVHKSGKVARGPRDLWKDPVLPKVAIFPDPEVKVEKVEPPEEESENSAGMDAVGIQEVVQDQDCVAVTVKEEERIPMDESSANDADVDSINLVIQADN